MDDDLIVVDDVDNEAGPSRSRSVSTQSFYASPPKAGTTTRLRSGSYMPPPENIERTTRSSSSRSKSQPKLKLKLGDKTASQAPGMSFLGQYDRELDSDEEDLAFEEQFILRMPPGEDCDKLRKAVNSREVGNDVWFKFKGASLSDCLCCNAHSPADSRRAVFHIGNNLYSSKLVDLPCIMESQKTLDGKQMFKVADICQVEIHPPLDAHFLNIIFLLDAGGWKQNSE